MCSSTNDISATSWKEDVSVLPNHFYQHDKKFHSTDVSTIPKECCLEAKERYHRWESLIENHLVEISNVVLNAC
jgi:hypothetical protein